MFIKAAIIILTLLFTSNPSSAQQKQTKPGEDQAVRLKTELIQVTAVVTDKQGRIIENLRKDDFEILEEGKPQQIGFFSKERIESAGNKPGLPRPPSQDERDNTLRSVGSGRSVVLFIDTLHLSGPSLIRAKLALKKFINESLTDRDLALVVSSDGTANALAQFTQDKQLLRHMVDRITGWDFSNSRFTPYLASLVRRGDMDAIAVAAQVMQREEGPPLGGLPQNIIQQIVTGKAAEVLSESAHKRRALLSVLRELAERVAHLPGQRLILFVSDGFTMLDTQGDVETGDVRAAISRAVRSGAIIYSLDAKGLQLPSEFDASLPGVGGDSLIMGRLSSFMSASDKDLQNGMNALAADTGGKAYFNTNDIPGTLNRMLDDNRMYYVLAYYPAEPTDADKFRRIVVRVKSREDYIVRTQKGYLASDLKKGESKGAALPPEQKLLEAISRPLPSTGIPVAISTDYLETGSDPAQVSLYAWIDGGVLDYRESNGRYQLDLAIATVVYDKSGRSVSTYSDSIKANMSDKDLKAAKSSGFRYGKRLQLKPGRYQIRVGVRESDGARIGTATDWVLIPDLAKGQLTLSSILLTVSDATVLARSESTPAARFSPLLGITYYKRGSLLPYNVSIYNVKTEDQERLLMQSQITRGEQLVYKSELQPAVARIVARDSKSITIGGQLRLELEPGIYELRISVNNPKSNKKASQIVTIGVAD